MCGPKLIYKEIWSVFFQVHSDTSEIFKLKLQQIFYKLCQEYPNIKNAKILYFNTMNYNIAGNWYNPSNKFHCFIQVQGNLFKSTNIKNGKNHAYGEVSQNTIIFNYATAYGSRKAEIANDDLILFSGGKKFRRVQGDIPPEQDQDSDDQKCEELIQQSKNNLITIATSFQKFCPDKAHIGVYDYFTASSNEFTFLGHDQLIIHAQESENQIVDLQEFAANVLQYLQPRIGSWDDLLQVIKNKFEEDYPTYNRTICIFPAQRGNHTSWNGSKAYKLYRSSETGTNYDALLILS